MWPLVAGITVAALGLAYLEGRARASVSPPVPPVKPPKSLPPATGSQPTVLSPANLLKAAKRVFKKDPAADGYVEEEEEEELPMHIRVKIMIAEGTGRLDLTDCRLKTLPPGVLELRELQDLSLAGNCLTVLPEGLGALTNLKRLGLAGNRLTELPASIGQLTQLELLTVHGNLLQRVPDTVSQLASLRNLNLSGNRLRELPDVWSSLTELQELSLSGNLLTQLPTSIGHLPALRKLACNGNQLWELPDLSGLQACQELCLQGNLLRTLPESLCELQALKDLSLADNPPLAHLPASFSRLGGLEKLWVYGCSLASLPVGLLSGMPSLGACWLEGNPGLQGSPVAQALEEVAQAIAVAQASVQAAPLQGTGTQNTGTPRVGAVRSSGNQRDGQGELSVEEAVWQLPAPVLAPGNPGQQAQYHRAAGPAAGGESWGRPKLRSLGLDTKQLLGTDPGLLRSTASVLKVGEVQGTGNGYFKLSPSSISGVLDSTTGSLQLGPQGEMPHQPALVVALGSAPGTPNWGGLLGRMYRAARSDAERAFDVLYVVDPSRQWYGAGISANSVGNSVDNTNNSTDSDSSGHNTIGSSSEYVPAVCSRQYYYERIQQYTRHYKHVVLLGDSMGGTGALLFATLATHVLAFTPQVDLSTSCMRPGLPDEALAELQGAVLEAVVQVQLPSEDPTLGPTGCRVVALSGTWQHDLDQTNLLPDLKVQHKVYSLDSHRLAVYLDSSNALLPLVQAAVLRPLGVGSKVMRTANLL